MKARLKRLLRIGAALALAAGTALLAYLRQGEDRAAEIRAGKLAFTSGMGWVNWGHARPEGVRAFLADLRGRWQRAGGRPFDVTYSQGMSCRWGWLGVESRLARTYRVTAGLRADELDTVAIGIFREVSDGFEAMQGRFPNAVDARAQSSSFRAGDIAGDRIAFCCALRGCAPDAMRSWLGTGSVEESLRQLAKSDLSPSRSWALPDALEASPLALPRHDPAWFAAHAALREERETPFRFYLTR